MRIQLIGTPCSGKSTFAKEFIKNNPTWKHFDLANYNNGHMDWYIVEDSIVKDVIKEPSDTIVESIQGFNSLGPSYNIMFRCEINDLATRHKKRRIYLTSSELDYYDTLLVNCIKPNITINTSILDTYDKIMSKLKLNIGGL